MSKLFRLREWLTLPEAARYLSGALSEQVGEADVLRHGLDGQLKLSVFFRGKVTVCTVGSELMSDYGPLPTELLALASQSQETLGQWSSQSGRVRAGEGKASGPTLRGKPHRASWHIAGGRPGSAPGFLGEPVRFAWSASCRSCSQWTMITCKAVERHRELGRILQKLRRTTDVIYSAN
jgi:hypothetical protein